MSDPIDFRVTGSPILRSYEEGLPIEECILLEEGVCEWDGRESVEISMYVEMENAIRREETLSRIAVAFRGADLNAVGEAAWSAAKMGPASIPVLIEALEDSREQVRIDAAWALYKIGSSARGTGAEQALIDLLADESCDVSFEAACALFEIDSEAARAEPAFWKARKCAFDPEGH